MIEPKGSLVGKIHANQKIGGKLNNAIEYKYPELEDLEVTPSIEDQVFKHENSYGYDEVRVKKVEGEELSVTPTTEEQINEGIYTKVITEKIPNEYIKPDGTINITENGTVDVKEYANAKVNVKGASIVSKGVDFIDYDGTLLYSYTVEEAQELTELPELPSHEGLICQGWNWSLEDIKELNRDVLVGAMYITDDGKTRLYISIDREELKKVTVYFYQGMSYGVEVDFGDGTVTTVQGTTSARTLSHTYENTGDYIITFNVVKDCLFCLAYYASGNVNTVMGGRSDANERTPYRNTLKKVEIGKHSNYICESTFRKCNSLETITIPNNITEIRDNAFNECYSLKQAVIPNQTTLIGNSCFNSCYEFTGISIPKSVETINALAFKYCNSLSKVTIPPKVEIITSSAFAECASLREIILVEGVKSIENGAFNNCDALRELVMPNTITSLGTSIFNSCSYISKITLSNSLTELGNECLSSVKCKDIIIPEGVTRIGNSALAYNYYITKIKIPKNVVDIGSSAFSYWSSMQEYDFSEHEQIPTIQSNTFYKIPTDCKIIVPDALYDTWIVATNWSTYASNIVKASEVV